MKGRPAAPAAAATAWLSMSTASAAVSAAWSRLSRTSVSARWLPTIGPSNASGRAPRSAARQRASVG